MKQITKTFAFPSLWRNKISLFDLTGRARELSLLGTSVIRDAVLQIIYKHITFPSAINGKGSAKVFHDSVNKLNDEIRDFYSEEKYKGVVD